MPDWDSWTYRRVSALQTWLATQSLSGVSMAGHERVLDIGCGDGRITAAIASQLPRGSILGIAWDFDSPEDFARWCTVGFGAWTARLPTTDQSTPSSPPSWPLTPT